MEQARLKEREVMMKELEHMKKALEDEKMSVYTQVHNLEEQLVCNHSQFHSYMRSSTVLVINLISQTTFILTSYIQ